MPKKNTPSRIKKQSPATKKLIAATKSQSRKDLTAQWRFLKKIGAYQSKDSAAQKRLTESRIRSIRKKMAEVQKQKMYKAGKVISPVQFGARKTRSGKTVYDYHLSDNFAFVKSKKKLNVTEGVKKTKTGYIIEKTKPTAKIKINKKGDIVETTGKMQRLKRRYSGEDMLQFMRDVRDGKIKFRKHDLLVFRMWGNPESFHDSETSVAAQFIQYIDDKIALTKQKDLARFLKTSHVEIIKMIDD